MTDKELLKSLMRRINLSQSAYDVFLKQKNYASALALYRINREALSFVMNNLYYLSDEAFIELQPLIIHWQGWMAQFAYEEKAKPSLNANFNFKRASGLSPWPNEVVDWISDTISQQNKR